MKTVLRIVGAALALVLIYVIATLVYGQLNDWRPAGVTAVDVDAGAADEGPVTDSVLSFLTWNVGYGGLGAEADFFLDGGAFFLSRGLRVHMPEADVRRYSEAIATEIGSVRADFLLLQEVDSLSDRSHGNRQSAQLRTAKPDYAAAFAPNYINERVPVPVFEPWRVYGSVYSGLLNLTRYTPSETRRHALPGEFPWPDRLFQLDRCLLVQRFDLADGRELVVVNLHLSAYDTDGSVKAAQLEYLAEFLRGEADAGHLVVAGGDWNLMPPNLAYDYFVGDPEGLFPRATVPAGYPAPGWTFVYDPDVPTNRKINAPYSDSTYVTTIDHFLLGPGLRAQRVKALDRDFRNSDHQAVYLEVVIE